MNTTGIIAVAVMLVGLGTSFGDTIGSAGSGNWTNTATWSGGSVPGSADTANIKGGHTIHVNSSVSELVKINVGNNAVGTLIVDSGASLKTSDNIQVGNNALGVGYLNLNGGSVSVTNRLLIGNGGGTGSFSIDGGELYLDRKFANALTVADGSTVAISDGQIKWSYGADEYRSAVAVTLIEGYVDTGKFTFGGTGAYVAANDDYIIAANATSYLYAMTDTTAGATQVWSTTIPEPATIGLVGGFGMFLLVSRRFFRI
jgi:hypothetical protein